MRHPLIASLVSRAMRRGLKRHFHAVRLSGPIPALAPGQGMIVFSNHAAWWDPAVFALLQQTLFAGRAGHGPIEARALARYPLLERAGLIPIDPARPGSLRRFLNVARDRLDRGDVLWITAQGHFSDARTRPLGLQAGLVHLARACPHALVVPLAIEYAFWRESRPEILMRFAPALTLDAGAGSEGRRRACEAALTATMDALARDVRAADAEAFRVVLSGGGGVGRVYDMLRRARAFWRGQHFDARHDARRPAGRTTRATRTRDAT